MRPLRASALLVAAALLSSAAAACNANSNPVGTNAPGSVCSVGTQVQLSSPRAGTRGNNPNIGQIQIVVDASTDLLGNSWNLTLTDPLGNSIPGGTLTLTSNNGGYHPFPTDYYYNSSIPPLAAGDTYSVFMNQFTSACTPMLIGSFST